MPPTVSVVIPAYNAEATIDVAIESVCAQTYRDFELIVVDDGSTDGTARRLRAFGERVRHVHQVRGGVASARNRGVAESVGEYVAFLDADDLWLARKLETQVAVLQREPAVDAVQCSAYLVDERLRVIGARRCSVRHDSCLDFLRFRNLPSFGSAVVVRRSSLEAVGGFSTDLPAIEDWDLVCRLTRRGRIKSVPDFLVLYRQHPGNRSRNVEIHIEAGLRVLDRFFADPGLDPALRRQEGRVRASFCAMVASGYLRHRQWRQTLQWSWRALRTSPGVGFYMAGLPLRRLHRARVARRGLSFEDRLAVPAEAGLTATLDGGAR